MQSFPSLSPPPPPSAQLGFLITVCLKGVIRLGRGRGGEMEANEKPGKPAEWYWRLRGPEYIPRHSQMDHFISLLPFEWQDVRAWARP